MSDAGVDVRVLRAAPVLSGCDAPPAGMRYRRPQGLDHHLLVLTVRGTARIGPPNGQFRQRIGDAILIEPRAAVYQDVDGPQSWTRIWVIFDPRPHWHDWLGWPRLSPGYRQLHLNSVRRGTPVRAALEAVHRHATGSMRRRGELAMNALEAALLWCDAANPRSERARLDPRIARAIEFIDRNFAQRITLETIAGVAGLSAPHVVKCFRQQLDASPMQFVERQRMQRAVALLQMTSKTVGEVAAEVGFEDAFYFSTRFKRFAGTSPRAFRRPEDAAQSKTRDRE